MSRPPMASDFMQCARSASENKILPSNLRTFHRFHNKYCIFFLLRFMMFFLFLQGSRCRITGSCMTRKGRISVDSSRQWHMMTTKICEGAGDLCSAVFVSKAGMWKVEDESSAGYISRV